MAKQEEKLKEIEIEKAKSATSEQENRIKELKIKELEGQNQTLQMQHQMIKETGLNYFSVSFFSSKFTSV